MNSQKRSSTLTFQKIKEQPRKLNTIRQKAGEEIKHNLSLLEATLESIPDGILVVGREGKITKYNKKFLQMWGIPDSILASSSDDQVLNFVLGQLKSPQRVVARIRELYAAPEAEGFDVLEFNDGRVFEQYYQPQRIGDQIVGRVWSFRDVTKRAEKERSLIKREEEAKRLSMENNILAEIGQIISSTLDINDIYGQFAGCVHKILPFDRISISILNPDRTSITIAYAFGVEMEGRPTENVLLMKEPVYEEVVNKRKSFLIQTEDEKWIAAHHPNYLNNFRSGIRSLMAIPLVSKDQVIGILNLQSCKPNAYTDADVKLAERIGNQIAGAIANAQLYAKQKRTEMALRESEDRYRDLVEFSEYLICTHDLQGKLLSVNQKAAEMLGYDAKMLIGRNIKDGLASEVKDQFDAYMTRIRQQGFDRGIMMVQTRTGEKRIWEYNNTIRTEGVAEPIVRGMAHDVTERKRMEKALIMNEKMAKRLSQENAAIAKIGQIIGSTLNIDEVYSLFAEEVRKLIPIDRISVGLIDSKTLTVTLAYVWGKELADRKREDVFPIENTTYEKLMAKRSGFLIQIESKDELKTYPHLLNAFIAGFRSIISVPLISKDEVIGGLNLLSLKPKNYTDLDLSLAERVGQQIAGAIANAQLFAEQKRIEKALRESEEHYRDLVEFSEYLISSHDLEGNILSVNQRAANLLGYEQGDLIGRNIRDHLAPEVKHEFDQYLETILREGKARGMMLILTASGEKRLWEYNNSLRTEGGTAQLVRGVAHDITDLKRIEKEREKLIFDLQNALSKVKQLSGLLPICSSCKKIRDDKGYWNQIEIYIRDHAEVEFSHGLCPDCLRKLYPDIKI